MSSSNGSSLSGFLPSLQSIAKGTAATAAGLSTVGFGLLYYGQNYLIYPSAFPPGSRTDVPTPEQFNIPYEDLELVTEDNVKLRCYLMVQSRSLVARGATEMPLPDDMTDEQLAACCPTVIMFHGNGGNVGHRIPLARVFYYKMRCNVLMVSYRGYGLSDGTPNEKGLKLDAQAALNYITSHPALCRTLIILYGQSIGGAVSIDLASRNPLNIRALILENTFLSLPRLVPTALPLLGPFSFLCHQKWDSASKLSSIPRTTPILMLSGIRDEVVPREHMQGLWEIVLRRGLSSEKDRSAKSELKETKSAGPNPNQSHTSWEDLRTMSRYVEFESGMHNDTCVQPGYWAIIADFIRALSAHDANSA